MDRIGWRVHGALFFVQITFGGFHVFGKYILGYLPPLTVAGIRVLLAAPLLLLVARLFDQELPRRRDLPHLALLGFLGIFVNQLLFIIGLQYTTATNAGILMPSIPVFAALAGTILGIEKLGWRRGIGVGLAVFGSLVMLDLARFRLAEGTAFGNVLILCNCLSYALFLVLARPILLRLKAMTVIAWAFLFGGSGVFLVSLPTILRTDFSPVPPMVWVGMLYIILIPTALNYSLNTWAIRHSSPALVAAYTTLQPVSAAVLAALFLGEHAGLREAAGFVLIVGGLILVSRKTKAMGISPPMDAD